MTAWDVIGWDVRADTWVATFGGGGGGGGGAVLCA